MNDDRDMEAALRASLAERARQAPTGSGLVEDIIAASGGVQPTVIRPRVRKWGTWTLPLLAASIVALVVGVLVTVAQLHGSSNGKPVAVQTGPGTTASSPAPTVTSTPTSTSSQLTGDSVEVHVVGFTHFRVVDTTFVGVNDGWALGTADCLRSAGSCTGMVRTLDGVTWDAVMNPPVNLAGITAGCTDPCATNIRFANDSVGYVYGPTALFMTTDGGQTWNLQPGGAYALETLDNDVIRVRAACTPGCPVVVQTSAIGSTAWTTATLPGAQAAMNSGVNLSRTGSSAFVDIYGHVAGGAQDATSVLYSSIDAGKTWTRRGEPCAQTGGGLGGAEVDSTAMTTASDGSVTVLCTPRGGSAPQYTSTSTDEGATFVHGALNALGSAAITAIGAASAHIILVADGDTFRTTNGGMTFARIGANGQPTPGNAIWFGFENSMVGRAVSGGGSTIWTTWDAGKTWKSYTFPP
ncbi:MAG: hypothetical protein M3N95_11030 [Actinomycetota bacterium]|nr:hypothetical protein [Actinomycetota bacterium]